MSSQVRGLFTNKPLTWEDMNPVQSPHRYTRVNSKSLLPMVMMSPG